jgi:hypothetical protein
MKNIKKSSLININRSFFKEGGDSLRHDLGFGIQLWKGAFATVRPSEIGLTWNIDSKSLNDQIKNNLDLMIYDI